MSPAPDDLIPLAAELVGCVRDYGPDEVAEVLSRVPAGRHDALAVVLAAMIDPDRKPAELLAWLDEPVPSREFTPRSLSVKAVRRAAPPLVDERREAIARYQAAGLSITETADRMGIPERAVSRHRKAIRAAREAGPQASPGCAQTVTAA